MKTITLTLSDSAFEELAKQFHPATSDYIEVNIGAASINQLRTKNPDFFWKHSMWYDNEPFADAKGKKKTLAIRCVPDSTNKTWDEQQALLNQGEVVPTAQEVVQAAFVHLTETGQYLFGKGTYVRTSSVDSDGGRVGVGFGSGGAFDVSGLWDTRRYGDLGVSAARQSLAS